MSHRNRLNISGLLLPNVIRIVEDCGGDVDQLFGCSGIDRSIFQPLTDKVSEEQFYAFIVEALKQTNVKGFGPIVGSSFSISSFGYLGELMLSSPNVRTSVKLLGMYSPIIVALFHLTVKDVEEGVLIDVLPVSQFEPLNHILLETFLGIVCNTIPILTGKPIRVDELSFNFTPSKQAWDLGESVAKNVQVNADSNRVVISSYYADLPIVTANPVHFKIAQEQCEADLHKLHDTLNVTERVNNLIRVLLHTNPTAQTIAEKLHMSERSLRKKLEDEGESFSALLQNAKMNLACYFLKETDVQISQITHKLGYKEASSFRSAFRNWTGLSPREWRNSN